jgi:hypothetical protein
LFVLASSIRPSPGAEEEIRVDESGFGGLKMTTNVSAWIPSGTSVFEPSCDAISGVPWSCVGGSPRQVISELRAGDRSDSWANEARGETPEEVGGGDVVVTSVRVGERWDREADLVLAEIEEMVVGSNDAGIGGGGMRWCSSDNFNQQKE